MSVASKDAIVDLFMSKVVSRVPPSETVVRAHRQATEAGHHHLMVTAGDDLVGVVCTCDLENAPSDASVSDHMSRDPVTIVAGTALAEAADRMARDDVGCLPVLSEGLVVGVLTRGDVMRATGEDPIGRICASCGERHHVHAPRGGVDFCNDCIDQVEAEQPLRDTGVGD
jgi:CBS domain-containing protein